MTDARFWLSHNSAASALSGESLLGSTSPGRQGYYRTWLSGTCLPKGSAKRRALSGRNRPQTISPLKEFG